MKKTALYVTATAILSGCAATMPTKWVNPSITDRDIYAARLREDAKTCRDVSSAYAPGGVAYIPTSSGSSYDVSGTVNGERFRGTVRPYGGGFAGGAATGANLGAAMRARIERDKQINAYVECMGQLGWVDGNAAPAKPSE